MISIAARYFAFTLFDHLSENTAILACRSPFASATSLQACSFVAAAFLCRSVFLRCLPPFKRPFSITG
jgi:hypothetical protein